MDQLTAIPSPVLEALACGWAVVTGSQRAARRLRRAYDLRQQALGASHWQPAVILAWDSWLAALWHRLLQDGHATELLLNDVQEHSVWWAIIAAEEGGQPVDGLATLAASAWSRLHNYRAVHALRGSANSSDTRAFARWAGEFERRCLRSGLLTTAQLAGRLAAEAQLGTLSAPAGLLLLGFDSHTPADHALLDALRATGLTVRELTTEEMAEPSGEKRTSLHLLAEAADPQHELVACAAWVRERLEAEPDAELGVIVPDIDADRAALDRALRHVLAPELLAVDAPAGPAPFEFSLGVALDRTQIAMVALDVLRWCGAPLGLDAVCRLLLSPHFAAATDRPGRVDDELLARAEFDAFVVRSCGRMEPRATPQELFALAGRAHNPAGLGALRTHLRGLAEEMERTKLVRDRTHGEWAEAFLRLLTAAGWAVPSTLDSIGYQARSKFESLLDLLASLDFDGQMVRVSFADAIGALERIAAETLFAPESQYAPVQILGPLEAAGSRFDAIWFLRASDDSWPPVPAAHPLLPYGLQRKFGMPGADTVRDAANGRKVTERIVASSALVVFSFARQTPEGSQRASPMLSAMGLQCSAAEALARQPEASVPVALDALLDDAAIEAPPAATLRGGAAILQAQAACGFRAFAERRLFSDALERNALGLDPRDRGSAVHDALHNFWSEVRTQSALRAMSLAERDRLLSRCVERALGRKRQAESGAWAAAYLEAERERMMRLLRPWLDFEAHERSAFIVKASEEQLSGVKIGPLELDIRIDRVDETVAGAGPEEAGEEIILDYKTGQAEVAEWEGQRPNSPQLPLYAVISPTTRLGAVAFASIRPGKLMGVAGYQSRPGILPSLRGDQTRDLEEKRREWRGVLERLADEFHAGRALADPKKYPETCRYCRQRLLCRLQLRDAMADEGAVEAEAEAAPSQGVRGPEEMQP